ncbi:MAG: HAMP domain-containing sensor histidine kinase [Actinomycetota bacterium]|uniref:histidine kinase n=1 Tax=Mycobacterium lentiflavum TaxID=141349 RepID=A0ABY3UUB4_MYCLN|nr:HAMP domain-containing sensor histidine kinase [Mycobacterium lentiflavum]MEE3065296.1 HAMP domain-containing sensor histidine kinase [Actinomycetota bacterium]ULP42153.1 HAMP domain-containing histidine kinase [Mycobacterium lentiflavum]
MAHSGRKPRLLHPRAWSISARSAVVSATVSLVALTMAGAILLLVLYFALISAADDAAASRLRDIARTLQSETTPDLDPPLLATDQRIVAVQILDGAGHSVASSSSTPEPPMLALNAIGSTPRIGITGAEVRMHDVRVAGQSLETPTGRYFVLVGAGTDDMESTVLTVAIGLAAAAPLVIAAAGVATYLLVRRSLGSVEAIRSRVADISASDLTERVPVPAQRDEIFTLATTMNQMLSRLESSQAAQRRFVADASHELRSPLSTVISALEVGVAHPELLDDRLAVDTLLPEARRMQALVEDLLLLARADERGLALRRTDTDIDDLAVAEVSRLRRETALDVHAELAPTRLVGDASALARVLRNLLDNAARHATSRVEVAVRSEHSQAWLTVADDGPGIAPVDRLRVFERFVRLDTDRSRSGGGTGLGLAIVFEIVAAHGGSVRIDDRPGGGTAVVVQLPLGTATSASSPASSR